MSKRLLKHETLDAIVRQCAKNEKMKKKKLVSHSTVSYNVRKLRLIYTVLYFSINILY